jgi:hypothetical protein
MKYNVEDIKEGSMQMWNDGMDTYNRYVRAAEFAQQRGIHGNMDTLDLAACLYLAAKEKKDGK